MRLTDLDPRFVRWEDVVETFQRADPRFNELKTDADLKAFIAAGQPCVEVTEPREHKIRVGTISEAQGICFDCPTCKSGHRIAVAFAGRGVLDHHGSHDKNGRPTRWTVVGGSGFDDLTLSPSIDCTPSDPKCWHGHIKGGRVDGNVVERPAPSPSPAPPAPTVPPSLDFLR